MAVPDEREAEIPNDRLASSSRSQKSSIQTSPKRCHDLDVARRRDMEVGLTDDVPNTRRTFGLKEILDDRRRVYHDGSQRRLSRSLRSARMSAAALGPPLIGSLDSIQSKISSRDGRETSRSKISSMNAVRVFPRTLARRLSSRWSFSGTFLT